MKHKSLKGYWCFRKPSQKWIKGMKIGIARLAILVTVGIVSFIVLKHFHVAGFGALAPTYLADRIAFEWLGDAFADAVEV